MSKHLIAITLKDFLITGSDYDPSFGLDVVIFVGTVVTVLICGAIIIGGIALIISAVRNYINDSIDNIIAERIKEIKKKKSRRKK